MNKIFTFFTCVLLFSFSSILKIEAQNVCGCWQPRDTSFTPVPFSYCTSECGGEVPPYYRNDDASTLAIVLPFNFCFWGRTSDTVYINTNGNITLGPTGADFTTFSPDTFPNTSVPPMIAPFWGDVDIAGFTGGSDLVLYKITAHYMIVQWDSVGYFNEHTDKLNSFQVILSDGTSPIIPEGNNVEFCYRQMQWTTGDASSGTGGFGGDPATVGANEGDGVRFIQMGLFDNASSRYVGQYPPAPYDGVAWLDNKSFLFNLCSGSIAPIISGVSPCDTFKICLGDSVLIPLYFFSPVQGDSVWSNLLPPILSGVSILSNDPGPTDSLIIKVVGNSSNLGYHIINVYGYDNATPQDTTFSSFVVEVDTAPHVHVMAVRDTICVGDTSTLTASGGDLYSWSTGASVSSIKVTPTVTTTYTVAVSNGGCYKDTTIKVIVFPAPAPSITAIPDSVCAHDSVLLIANGGDTYIWGTGQTKDSIWVVPDSNTTYTLSASNGFCSGTTTKIIKIRTKVTAVASIIDSVICPHDTAYLTVTATGASATYKWSNGATTSTIMVTDSVTTTYTATVYGFCDTLKLTKTVTVIPLPALLIKGTNWKCHGIKDTLTVTNLTHDSTTYVWNDGSTKTTYYTGSINADSTIYVTAKNSLGCSVKDSFKITLRNVPDITIVSPRAACSGLSVVITAEASGTGPFTYSWSPGGQTTDSITVVSPPDSATSTYTVTVSNGCISSKVTTITAEYPILNTITTQTLVLVNDTTSPAYSTLWASGNSVGYQWEDSIGVTCVDPPKCDSVRVTPTLTTTYTVIGTDVLGCETMGYVTVEIEIPCFNFIVPNVFTPNYEGANGHDNEFYMKTENINGWSIVIFDRWGKEMYSSTDLYKYWNGTTESGDQAPDGVYYYIITGTCQNTTYKKEGFVQLIR